MPLISRKTIDEVHANASMLALAQDYTSMTRAGSQWKGLSPFASEKTPSFFVSDEKNCYYCYSTGQGGGPVNFVMKLENLSFPEAIERLAKRFGITVEYEQKSGGGNAPSISKSLFELHAFAVTYFSQQFNAKTDEAARVRDYWQNARKFSTETAYNFSIGFLPNGGSRAFLKAARERGFSENVLLNSGFFGNINNAKPMDLLARHVQFEARLIIPIHDMLNRVIAFTARKIPGITPDVAWEEAKYKNSAETEIFKKSKTLFNLNRAKLEFQLASAGTQNVAGTPKISAQDRALRERELKRQPFVIVEGQLDAIRCYENGLKTAVAGQGTSITQEHMALLARYSTRLDCLLDADSAGQKAALRLLPLAFKAGLDVSFLSVPGGKDPDEFLATRGAAGTQEILATRVPATTFLAKRFGDPAMSEAERRQIFEECFEIFMANDSAVSREAMTMELARRVGVNPEALVQDFRKFQQKKVAREREKMGVPVGREDGVGSREQVVGTPEFSAEADILLLILKNKNYELLAPFVDGTLPVDSVNSENCAGKLLNRLINLTMEGDNDWQNWSIDELAGTPEESDFLSKLFMREIDRGIRNGTKIALRRFCNDYCSREGKRLQVLRRNLASNDLAGFRRLSEANKRILRISKLFSD